MHKSILFIPIFVVIACTQTKDEILTNESGGYSVTIPSGYMLYEMENSSVTIVSNRTPIIEATFYVTTMESEYNSLEESFNSYVSQIPSGFENYASLGNGFTQIKNKDAMWHRMRYFEEGVSSTHILYLIQPAGKKLFVVGWGAPSEIISKYEKDFTKMTFSLSILDN